MEASRNRPVGLNFRGENRVTRVSSSSWHHAVMGCNGGFFFFPIFPIFSTDAPTTPLHRAGKYRIDKSAGPGAAPDGL